MDKDFLIQLTNNLYQLTLLFPKKEPLRYKIREAAANILASPTEKDFKTLNSFFEVAKFQNWVNPTNILAIQADYDNLRRGLQENYSEDVKPVLESLPLTAKTLVERQEKILSVLKEKGRAQVWEMKQVFPQVSKRTLRRDFEFLLKQGMVERMGEKNNTFYKVKLG